MKKTTELSHLSQLLRTPEDCVRFSRSLKLETGDFEPFMDTATIIIRPSHLALSHQGESLALAWGASPTRRIS